VTQDSANQNTDVHVLWNQISETRFELFVMVMSHAATCMYEKFENIKGTNQKPRTILH
jgi:hypothetical protein